MFNKLLNKTSIIIFLVTIILLGGIGYYINQQAFDNSKIQSQIENEFLGKYSKIGNFTDINYYRSRDPELILSKYDIVNPVFSILDNSCVFNKVQGENKAKKDCDSFSVKVAYLKRVGITSWEISDLKTVGISQTTYNKAKNTLQNNDISKLDNNFDGQIIYVGVPLTPTQILQTQRTETFIQKQTENIQTLKTGTPEEKIKVLEYDISRGNGFISAFQKGEKTYENQPLTPELIETVKTQIADRQSQIEQIKKENP